MTPLRLAWANLIHKRGRTAIATCGVAFAVTLIFMELGLLGGVGRTATMLFDKLEFDLLITSSEYLELSRPSDFPRERLAQSKSVPGVRESIPLYMGVAGWRLPSHSGLFGITPGGGIMSINVLALPPERIAQAFRIGPDGVFASEQAARTAASELGQLDTFLFDRRSKPEFGDVREIVSLPEDGRATEAGYKDFIRINGKRAIVAGDFHLGTGFSWNGMLMTGEETYGRYMMQSTERVNFGLVSLEAGTDPLQAERELRGVLPPDVKVYTREQITSAERRYWIRVTSIGQFLMVAVVLAIVVGVIFVYQMMAADIRKMMPEYATVKALGYRRAYLTRIVLAQALLLAMLGYAPAFLASLGLYAAAKEWGGIPTGMTVEIAVGVFVLACGMCLSSGLLAVRKVHTADPADLF
jgi:putative ABC transport system permease protein